MIPGWIIIRYWRKKGGENLAKGGFLDKKGGNFAIFAQKMKKLKINVIYLQNNKSLILLKVYQLI